MQIFDGSIFQTDSFKFMEVSPLFYNRDESSIFIVDDISYITELVLVNW